MERKTYSFEENPLRSEPFSGGGRLIGSVVDKYEILRKVGEGGMATVYLARHVTLGREVAIKLLHPHLSASSRNRKRFAREARAIEHLDHENILKIFDYSGVDVDDCYIVTEYVRGSTLHALLDARGLLPSELVALIGIRLAQALSYAHLTGIIHRDLKPENVMLREDGVVKLMDFGIARFLDESTVTMTGALVGSPAYMSPEQALEKVVDTRSDLFSLGSMLFHLVTGQMPFSGSNASVILRNIIEGSRAEVLELQPGASPQLADVIERLLQLDPDSRYADASEVAEALIASLEGSELDPEDPSFSIAAFLADPDDYERRLNEHLDGVLLRRGREAFAAGDHLGAQRLLNRLLVQEPEHPEVLELLMNLHQPEPDEGSAGWGALRLVLGAIGLLLFAGLAWTQLAPTPEPPEPETPEAPTELASPELPTSPVELPAQEAAPESPELPPEPPEESVMRSKTGEPIGERRPITSPREPPPHRILVPDPKRPEEAEVAPPELEQATVTVRVTDLTWADAFLDGKKVGQVRQPLRLQVAPGPHVLLLTNTMSKDSTTRFEVGAGEQKEIEVTLVKKPISVRFRASLDPDCDVIVDGETAGSIAGIGGAFDLQDPDAAHMISLRCPNSDEQSFTVEPGRPGSQVMLPPAP
ncbi:MAG: protein kinase [Alphaproteobacteria bacterium]|nr:protein kinase [Alphaproteobacteria bacterium]